jgi:ParB/RepB/Spo0J family partition protein
MTSLAPATPDVAATARSAGPEFQYVKTAAIVASKTNPRKTFDAAYISDLARSVREVGVLEPILVRPHGDEGFELIAGECRWRAAKEAALEEMPVRIRALSDAEVLEVQVIENLQRRDLHPLEEAAGYRQLLATKKYDVARIAERIGMSAKYVYDRIRLDDLTPKAKQLFRDDRITAGHAILLARLKPADQELALKPGALFDHEDVLWDPEKDDNRYSAEERHLKARSVRELDGWINEHVRFDHTKDADPMLFPETALKLKNAETENTKVVTITYDTFVQEQARDDKQRTFAPQSWERADGTHKSKTCEYSVLGVVAAGPGRGEAFDVCIAKEKCKTHWAQWQRDREKRAAGQTPSSGPGSAAARATKEQERQRREREKQEKERLEYQAFQARFRKASPALAKAFAASIRKAPTNAGGMLGQFLLDRVRDFRGVKKGAADLIPAGKSAEDLVRYLVFVDIYGELTDDWAGPREIPKIAKTFGVDVKRILDEVAPVAKPAAEPVATCRKCGCTDAKACAGGCSWTEEPDPKTGKGLCSKCAAATRGSTPAKKRSAAAARA